MKHRLSAATALLFSGAAFAAAPIPYEIYSPTDAEVFRAELPNSGEFEARFRIRGRHYSVASLAQKVRDHALRQGFRQVQFDVDAEDAELKFRRGSRELDVNIKKKNTGVIEYRADVNLDKA